MPRIPPPASGAAKTRVRVKRVPAGVGERGERLLTGVVATWGRGRSGERPEPAAAARPRVVLGAAVGDAADGGEKPVDLGAAVATARGADDVPEAAVRAEATESGVAVDLAEVPKADDAEVAAGTDFGASACGATSGR